MTKSSRSRVESLVQGHIARIERKEQREEAAMNRAREKERLERELREAPEKERCRKLVRKANSTLRRIMKEGPTLKKQFDRRTKRYWDIAWSYPNGGYGEDIWDGIQLVKADDWWSMHLGINRRDGSILDGALEILLLHRGCFDYFRYMKLEDAPSDIKQAFEAVLKNFLKQETAIKYLLEKFGWQ